MITLGNFFNTMKSFFCPLQPIMFPPEPFGMLRRFRCVHIFLEKVNKQKNVTPEKGNNKHNMLCHRQTKQSKTPGGYKFEPLVANQLLLWWANQHKDACDGLSCHWSFPSRSCILLHTVVQPWPSLQRSISP